jgi:hypothetical protein
LVVPNERPSGLTAFERGARRVGSHLEAHLELNKWVRAA